MCVPALAKREQPQLVKMVLVAINASLIAMGTYASDAAVALNSTLLAALLISILFNAISFYATWVRSIPLVYLVRHRSAMNAHSGQSSLGLTEAVVAICACFRHTHCTQSIITTGFSIALELVLELTLIAVKAASVCGLTSPLHPAARRP